MELAATPSSFDVRNVGPCDAPDMSAKTHVHSSAELRQLAARWRCELLGEDQERAERVARTLEWVAEQRERRRELQVRDTCGRLMAWFRRLF
jgi:hypothetical protein